MRSVAGSRRSWPGRNRSATTQNAATAANPISPPPGLVGVPSCTGYVATKHAVSGLTKATALEYARQGIRVNAVCPGAVDTPLLDRFFEGMTDDVQALSDAYAENHPVGRIGQSSEIGEAVAWLLSDKASFVTGITMPVDGGWTAQ